ncbi:MAG: N-acetylglucosamine-6-phosphate deacetylase [Sphingomonas sp.]
MITTRFRNGHVVVGGATWPDVAIEHEGGRIVAIGRAGDHAGAVDLDGGWLLPGFLDVQVNGGGGVLFNDAISVEGIAAIGAAHARFGTTGFLPTLISDHPDRIAAALEASDAAIAAGVPGVMGVHIEGPFLSPERKGIHDADRFRPLDDAMVALLTRPHRGVVLVTLAPERVEAAQIRALVAAGLRVSAGHTDVDEAGARRAFDAGVTGVTHLFNAMRPMRQRDPGLIGAALDDPRPWCGLIVDGVHVSPTVLRIALAARGPERMMLVTDAMPSVGARDKNFVLQGRDIHVENGVCAYADGTLAGADLDMATAFRNAVRMLGLTPEVASAMAAAHPAAFLGLDETRGSLAAGRRADWVRLDADLAIVDTWIGGESIAMPAAEVVA